MGILIDSVVIEMPEDGLMPKFEVISAKDAPGGRKKQSPIAHEILAALSTLKKDEVLKLSPDEGKSVRGVKTSVGRIAANAGVKVTSWDDGQAVYVAKG
jgi:hypothetical protein